VALCELILGPWNTALHRELAEFPASENDDQVDALSLIGRRYPLLSSPTPPVVVNLDPYAGYAMRVGADGRTYTNATLDEMFEERESRVRHGRW
jgi:hypothetical protein